MVHAYLKQGYREWDFRVGEAFWIQTSYFLSSDIKGPVIQEMEIYKAVAILRGPAFVPKFPSLPALWFLSLFPIQLQRLLVEMCFFEIDW